MNLGQWIASPCSAPIDLRIPDRPAPVIPTHQQRILGALSPTPAPTAQIARKAGYSHYAAVRSLLATLADTGMAVRLVTSPQRPHGGTKAYLWRLP